MIKILIADDEPHFREYMRKAIEWESLGVSICAVCKNGHEALEAMQEFRPRIALLDINMPGCDGMTLAENMQQMEMPVKVVFITGYSEFEYARRALKVGAADYLLKPFSRVELANAVLKLVRQIREEDEDDRRRAGRIREVREKTLGRTLLHHSPEGVRLLEKQLKEVGVSLEKEFFLVAVVEIDKLYDYYQEQDKIDLWIFAITNIMEELMGGRGICGEIFAAPENHVALLTNFEEESLADTKMCELTAEFEHVVNNMLPFTATIGIGCAVRGIGGTEISYRQALAALQEKFLRGGASVYRYSEVSTQDTKAQFYRLDTNDELLKALRKNDGIKIRDVLKKTQKMALEQSLSPDYVHMVVGGMLSICLSYISDMGGDIAEILGPNFSPYLELGKKKSIEESFSFVKDILEKTAVHFQASASRRAVEILQEANDYIQQHYGDFEFSVEKLAAALFLDASYIRRIFAQQMHVTVSGYLLEIRMKQAKLYLEEGGTVGDVAAHVGFMDQGYFSRCFKKYFGVSPRQYLNQFNN